MEQARNYLCLECQTPVPTGHKFCGRCGQVVPPSVLEARTDYFSDVQDPSKARLIVVRGEGLEGLSFHLKAESHTLGRTGQIAFPEDRFVSPKHASFVYRDAKLVVNDEGSLNGIYIRIRGTVAIAPGDMFLAGEQVFRLDEAPKIPDPVDEAGTVFYVSPTQPTTFRITQLLEGGAPGVQVGARGNALQIGRFDSDLNFPDDSYLSSAHCKVEESGGGYLLTDMNSRNGTYLRIASERELAHGDYLFFGRKLLRVEMNAN